MRTILPWPLPVLSLALLLVGCSGKTDTYRVAVQNSTDAPITIGLAKDGGPYEDIWASPEEAALNTAPDERPWGVIVESGKTGSTGPIKGTFPRGARGYLRVYAGTPTMSEILATNRDSILRVDVPLAPGANNFMIVHKDGRLAAVRAEALAAEE